jgi:hypothetical protein
MLPILESICTELDSLAAEISVNGGPEPYSIVHNNWSFPGIDRAELSDRVKSLAKFIRENEKSSLVGNVTLLNDYPRRLQYLRSSTIPNLWGNAAAGVSAIIFTIDGLRNVTEGCLDYSSQLSAAEVVRESQALKRATARIRALESRLSEIEPRSNKLSEMIDRIQNAHEAADQLPTDLASLEESRVRVELSVTRAEKDQAHISNARDEIDLLKGQLRTSANEAAGVVAKCEAAYSTATSQGLAAAFSERSVALDKSMWAWVVGLIIALGLGGFFGASNLQRLLDLMKLPSISAGTVMINTVLSLLSVAAPVWFAWLSTKQIGQRFRLAEDYAFKASVSRAYEGYRREASRIDADLEMRLLASALDRLDEQPLRLVEGTSHGSPWQEMLSSELVREAVKSVPGFANSVAEAARGALDKVRAKKPVDESGS